MVTDKEKLDNIKIISQWGQTHNCDPIYLLELIDDIIDGMHDLVTKDYLDRNFMD